MILKQLQKNIVIVLLVLISIVIFRAAWNSSYIGYFSDDANYISLAKSLLTGKGYISADMPGTPPHRMYLPGFPIVLIPFVAIFGEQSEQLKWVNTISTSLTIGLYYFLFKDKLPKLPLIALIMLFPINLLNIIYSSSVMSDSVFCLLGTLTLYMISIYANNSNNNLSKAILIGVLVTICTTVRVVGLALLVPVLLLGFIQKDFKLILSGILPITILLAFAHLYGWLDFYAVGLSSTPFNVNVYVFGANIIYYLREMLALVTNSNWAVTSYWWLVWFNWFLLLPFCIGLVQYCKKHGILWISYLLAYLFALAFFRLLDIRLLLPVLPLIYFYIFFGLMQITSNKKVAYYITGGVYAITIMVMLFYMNLFFKNIVYKNNMLNTPPVATFQWIKSFSLPSDIFLSQLPAQLFYFTNRQGLAPGQITEPVDLLKSIHNASISYLYIFPWYPSKDLYKGDITHTKFYLKLAQENPRHFKLVYYNKKENTYVYKIIQNKQVFYKALTLIDKGSYFWQKKDYTNAIKAFNESLTIEPDFYLTLNSLGILLADTGHYKEALATLNKSVSLYSSSCPQCFAALAYVYQKSGNKLKAIESLTKGVRLSKELDLYQLSQNLQVELNNITKE